MKKVLLSIAAAATLAAAVPAMAAPFGHGPVFAPGYGAAEINQRERDIAIRIDRGQRDGSLTMREARGLRADLAGVENLEGRYARNGLDVRERADLNLRLDRLSLQVRGDRHDRDGVGRDRRF